MPGQVEARLAAERAFARTDVLKIPHHGSRTSTTDALLEQLRPAFAVISVGCANPYGHPHPQMLERLARWRATPLRTDLLGQIRIVTDGRSIEVAPGLPLALR
jgi:competence protein ComEC